MSVRAMSLVWERSRAKGSNRLMLLAIADYAHDDGSGAFPSARTLSFKCQLTGRGSELILAKLVVDGELRPVWEADEQRLYLEVRCVSEWDAYRHEGPTPLREKISRSQRENFSRKLVGLFGQSKRLANGATPLANSATPLAKIAAGHTLLLSDPSGSTKNRSAVDSVHSPLLKPVENSNAPTRKQIERLTHEALSWEPFESQGELAESVKRLCTAKGFDWKADLDLFHQSIDSALAQAGHRQGGRRR